MNHDEQVIYITPFDRRREMPRWMAENFFKQDRERYERLDELDTLTADQRYAGPPRIEERAPA